MLRIPELVSRFGQVNQQLRLLDAISMSSLLSERANVHRERLVQAVLALYDNTLAREQSPVDTSQPAPHGALASPAEPEELWDNNVTFRQ